MGLLSFSANEENMRLKLTLILCSLLSLGETECVKKEGNIRRVPLVTFMTTWSTF